MKKLFLDDLREAPGLDWDVVRSYDKFVEYLTEHGCPDVVSFDHDLSFEHYPLTEDDLTKEINYARYAEKTGYHAAQWMIQAGHTPKLIIVHSYNPVGAQNIARLFEKHCVIDPYPSARGKLIIGGLENRA
jgi:hypothetical protein